MTSHWKFVDGRLRLVCDGCGQAIASTTAVNLDHRCPPDITSYADHIKHGAGWLNPSKGYGGPK